MLPPTCDPIKWVKCDLWRGLIGFALCRRIQHTLQQCHFGVKEHKSPCLTQQRCHALRVGTTDGRSEVNHREEERLEGGVEGLEEGEPQT